MKTLAHKTNKLLVAALVCSIALAVTSSSSCDTKDDSSTKYEREYAVDWEHGFQEGLGEVEVNGNWGFINSSGLIVIKPQFNQVLYPFSEGIALVRKGAIMDTRKAGEFGRLAGKYQYIDEQGRIIYEPTPVGKPFSEGLAAVYVGAKWGIMSKSLSGKEGKWGFINIKGEMVIPPQYDDVDSFSEGLAAFKDPNGKYGFLNTKGEVEIRPRYSRVRAFSEGLAAVCMVDNGGKEVKCGFINKRGEVVVPVEYDFFMSVYSEGLVVVEKNNKRGGINKRGDVVIPFQYDHITEFREGFAAVKKDEKWGYIDCAGRLVIPLKFDDADPFSEGLAKVTVGQLDGYIDKKGDFVIEPKFNLASPFTEGFAKVAVGNKLGYIDREGNYIWEPTR